VRADVAKRLWRVVDAACFFLSILLFLACIFAPKLYVFFTGV
jgi:hypothetical protein